MHLSIIGSQGCGKTALFNAFSGMNQEKGSGGSTIAIVEVPDERLNKLTEIYKPKKTVHGRIEISDIASIAEGDMKNETVPAKQLQQMRLSDAFLLVLRNFDNGTPPDPVADFHTLLSEFIIADMIQIETRIDRIKKQMGKKDANVQEQEKALLEECLVHVEAGKPLSTLARARAEERGLRGFQFLSLKPLMIAVNCAEEMMKNATDIEKEIAAKLDNLFPVAAVCARLEEELATMDPADREVFMAEYGLTESLRGRLIRLAYETLGLISFLTVGEDECRAWPIRKGVCAQEAAASIHTDLSDKFIRAETVAYVEFVRHGDMNACKKAGVWRLEGKQYTVQDGDIICIRAGN
jgi:ribosome-binding ATPase